MGGGLLAYGATLCVIADLDRKAEEGDEWAAKAPLASGRHRSGKASRVRASCVRMDPRTELRRL
jgi:hypothetical protein